jgi:hypothetical protein
VDLGNLVHERSFPTMDLWRMGICTIRYDINGVDCYCVGERGGEECGILLLAWRSVVSGLREDSCFMIAPVHFEGRIPDHDFLLCSNLIAFGNAFTQWNLAS